jgi:toxin-antitoxin system PIN domain toxin
MILCDMNVLIDAFREESARFSEYNVWLNDLLNNDEPYAVSDQVLSGFIRIVTNPSAYKMPTPLSEALTFVDLYRHQPHARVIQPSSNHWNIFTQLCQKTEAIGGHITDAYFAALAIDSGCEWVTSDRDYSRYPGLRWRHPLDS